MGEIKITVTKILVGSTVRIKFDILHSAQHFGFVRFFALTAGEIMRPPDRAGIAKILREEHRAAWKRYHDHTNA